MTRVELLAVLRSYKLAVQASLHATGAPQAALVGVAFSDALEVVFDTLASTRKAANLRRDPRVAIVVGDETDVTVQREGVADEPTGAERERLLEAYFAAYPDGRTRLAWEGITHFRVRPTWVRVSDYRGGEAKITELDAAALAALPASA